MTRPQDTWPICESPEMRKVWGLVEQIARTNVTVVIVGETGTGKDVLAAALHAHSLVADKQFRKISCVITEGLPQDCGLLVDQKIGTIYLDEVGDCAATTQRSLLVLLQEVELRAQKQNLNRIRILASTSHDLEKAVEEGKFRKDLYYRINEFRISLPPLRDRTEDVSFLASRFLCEFSAESGKRIDGISPEAMKLRKEYHWPGNVRELRNTLRIAVVSAKGLVVQKDDLPPTLQRCSHSIKYLPASNGDRSLKAMERRYIAAILQETDWSKTQASRILGISRPTLDKKISAYDIKRDSSLPT